MTGTGDADQFKGMTRSGDDVDDVGQSPNLDLTNSDGSNSREPQMVGDEDSEELIKSECLRYAQTIKDTVTIDKYIEFLRIMRNYHKCRIDDLGIKEKVTEVFEGHPELLLTFNTYLSEISDVNLPREDELRDSKKPIQYEVVMNFVNNMKMGLQDNYHIYISFLEVLNLYRMGKRSVFHVHQEVADLLGDHPDLLMEFTTLFSDYRNTDNQYKHSEKETIGSRAEHSQLVGGPDSDHEKAPARDDKEHPRGDEKGKERSEDSERHRSTHKSYVRSLEDTVLNLFPTDMHDRVVCLCKTVKEQLRNPDDYSKFLKCIKHYQTENINLQQLQSLVHALLQDHPNLMKEFSEVINHNRDKNSNKVEKGKRKRSATGSQVTPGSKRSRISKKDKNKVKPLRELDLYECESCTPSYRLVPKDYPLPETTQRKELHKEVLNDHWVGVSYGQDFQNPFKNKHEEKLSEFEDDRYEMDMALECIKVTIERAEKLVMMISEKSIKTEGLFPLERYFPGSSLRCIKVLYGGYGHNVIMELRKNISLSLPRILSRLKQKQEEWRVFSSGFNKLWEPVFASNHQMSLDHHGAYLEHQDSKILCNNDLLAEISEGMSEDNKLECKYSDLDIHKDFNHLIKLSCSDIYSSEKLDRATKIWTSFIEPIFSRLFLRSAGCTDDRKHIEETSISHEQIMNSNANVPEETHGKDGNDSFLEFLTNAVDFSAIVDLEKGGFAAYMNDSKQNYDREGVSCSEAVADNTVETSSSNDRKNVDNVNEEDQSMIFYGDDDFYVLFRLHQAVYARLEEVKQSANDSYSIFLDLLCNYLSGAYKDKYEDECRTIFGNLSGLIFSIERLIKKLSKQLLAIAMDEVDNKLLDLYASEKIRESGRFVDEVYATNARMIVTANRMFRFERLPIPDKEGQTRLTIQLIDLGPYRAKSRGKGKSCSRRRRQ